MVGIRRIGSQRVSNEYGCPEYMFSLQFRLYICLAVERVQKLLVLQRDFEKQARCFIYTVSLSISRSLLETAAGDCTDEGGECAWGKECRYHRKQQQQQPHHNTEFLEKLSGQYLYSIELSCPETDAYTVENSEFSVVSNCSRVLCG